jgi:hypothetical protein
LFHTHTKKFDKRTVGYIRSAAGAENFLLFTSSIPGLGTTEPNSHIILGSISFRIKETGREAEMLMIQVHPSPKLAYVQLCNFTSPNAPCASCVRKRRVVYFTSNLQPILIVQCKSNQSIHIFRTIPRFCKVNTTVDWGSVLSLSVAAEEH